MGLPFIQSIIRLGKEVPCLMSKRRFKIIYFPEGRSDIKEYRFTGFKFASLLTAGIFSLLLIIAAISASIIGLFPDYRLQSLSRENQLLYDQIGRSHAALNEMQEEINRLSESDIELRLMADLPLIDEATRQAGIGGSLPSPGIDPAQDMQNLLEKLERQIDLQQLSLPEILVKMEENLDVAAHTPAIAPLEKIRITSRFGYRKDPFSGYKRPHKGLDFGAMRGTPIMATADGRVTMSKRVPTFGKVVIINHGFGFETVYGHMQSFNVKVGDKVKRRDVIGLVGNTGRSKGPHLHYEVRVNSKQVDPLDYVFDESVASIK